MANKKGKILNKYSLIKKYSSTINTNIATTIKKDNLSFYLAGLIEGDGYISITNQNRIILGITFNIKDKPLADKLLNVFGKGYIVERQTNSIELRFSDVSSLKKIIMVLNGKFRTPKIDQLYKLIDWMNKNHSLCIPKLPIDNSPLNNNSWLAGFIDADGSFYIRFSIKQIICKFSLEQRMIYPKTKESFEIILNYISLFLNVKLAIRSRLNYKDSYYIIRVENQHSIQNLIDYLDNYPLLSSKYLDYLEWKKAFIVIKNKNHFSEEGKILILVAKNSMNNNRNYFNWDHLKF
uniref:Intronic protein at intron 2 of cox1 protein n=2 Tax=Tricholoma matsutake TaxID=40145 RepID=A0A3G9EXY8_TRIMT|nr:intronic protein at intron 2 of cox1 gene [Tricholoma matsutake]